MTTAGSVGASEDVLIDISPPLEPRTAVWPGDCRLSRSVALDMQGGANLTLSSLTTTVHIGAHADAPSHYVRDGAPIDQVDLRAYVGPCTVVTCEKPFGNLIQVKDCEAAVRRGARRLIFRTLSQPDPCRFNTDFVALSPEAVDYMGQHGVLLVGLDTASVDPFDSKDLKAHHALIRNGIKNLEGLSLAHVADGDYELIALPLRLVGFDASPVRAVLRVKQG